MKICTIVGARPQFIKAAVVSRALANVPSCVEIIIHTGQHYDPNMSDIFFDEMEIPKPAYNLGVGGGTHGQNTGRMIEGIEAIFLKEQPDFVLVYGDTDSTLAGALAAVKLHIPVAHVEAGLRSFNRKMPEEINRVLTDHASDILFVPTKTAKKNLLDEGISGEHVQIVGDVMLDAARFYGRKAEEESNILKRHSLHKSGYILATIHRAENTNDGDRMRSIFKGFSACNDEIILPIHPRTQKMISNLGLAVPGNVRVIDPVGYLDMVALEKNAMLIATDSGGVQKEAYFHEVPCITLRDETEWVELVDAGANILVGADSEKISVALSSKHCGDDVFSGELYGDGDAAGKIVSYLSAGL
ncbi:non-hydrolyzing UDP-N-acetylglucosamine 2-epimerase [Micavibrio aeruginosavorus]|uniref:UDP-N-acetylglucosamine 2-epimerase n=1 Tax=Micavibrio aeruginosavorus (strain ARL-13) TaxID=856793 RepID=G2KLX5_MICAA|nr:UDP-N-acetylglucosamine 2-epimerase (non-hydrolyzing) [Micavibrio aeruginosavorus]AEP09354.1 UDP-N-acetylglucosamine 2-epimerase [Micavibrio aeruginosavorus ARL-13]